MAPTDLSEEEEEAEEEDETSSMDTGARGQVPPFEAECEIAANSVVVQVQAVQRLVVGCLGATSLTMEPSVSSFSASKASVGHLTMEPSVSSSSASVSSSKTSSLGTTATALVTSGHLTPLAMEPRISSSSASVSSSKASSHKARPYPHAPAPSQPHESLILTSFDQLSALLDKYLHITSKREEWYKKKLKSERRRQSVWEESLTTVVREGEILEDELRERRRRRGRTETIKAREMDGFSFSPAKSKGTMEFIATVSPPPPERRPDSRTQAQVELETTVEEYDDDSEDEFFDAIESNNLPGLVIPRSLSTLTSPACLPPYLSEEPYSGMWHLTLYFLFILHSCRL